MLILASASPRRHELLLAAGIDHVVRAAPILEEHRPGEPPARLVERLAEQKVRAVPSSAADVVLGADTVVCLDDLVLGKPTDDDDTRRMLRLLSGREHYVYTGICILARGRTIRDVAITRVSFERMPENEIEEAFCAVSLASWGAQDNRTDWKQQGILYLDRALNARLHTVPVQAVRLGDGFWSARRKATTERSLPTLLDLLEEHGVVDNFRRLAGRTDLARKGPLYTDSDLYKWIEAASWALASNETSDADKQKLRGDIESLTTHILAAQEPSGYLNTYYVGDKTRFRFTELSRSHEDYCLGHLLQAGIAYYRATGSRRLLDAGIRFADYIVEEFGPAKRPFVTGHPELEMALIELCRTTGQTKYLDFARYLFSGVEKDRLKLKDADMRYMFSGKPFVSHTEFEGHAVRALYAASGATDYFTEAGDPAFKRTLDLLWTDLTTRKMYITGGVGSRSGGESFGDPYELPSEQAYAETCAAIANVMWNFRMLTLTGDARYADVLERALYNGVNSGMSLSGNLYCYRNPLASSGEKLRNPWYDTTCCPPNIERLFESLPGYFYALSRDGVYVNLYHM